MSFITNTCKYDGFTAQQQQSSIENFRSFSRVDAVKQKITDTINEEAEQWIGCGKQNARKQNFNLHMTEICLFFRNDIHFIRVLERAHR